MAEATRDPALFPLVISLPGSVLALVALYFDVRALRPAWQSGTAAGSSFLAPFLELRSALLFILSLAAIPLSSLIIDQRRQALSGTLRCSSCHDARDAV
jgi:hypothetical protein